MMKIGKIIIASLIFLGAGYLVSGSASAATNLVPNNGLESSSNGATPDGWGKGRWGSNAAVFTYPVVGYQSQKAAQVSITSYSSGDAKWYFQHVPVKSGYVYKFTDVFKSDTRSYVTVQFRHTDGRHTYRDLEWYSPFPDWTLFVGSFTVPEGVVSVSIFHLIKSVGTLTVDNYSLIEVGPGRSFISINFDDGYLSSYQNAIPILNEAGFKSDQFIITGRMNNQFPGYVNPAEIQAMQAQGHKIGAHTRTHPNLTSLTLEQLEDEVKGSRDDLLNIGVNPEYFAYPYGAYNNQVTQMVKNAGFKGARSSDGGFNDTVRIIPYALKRVPMTNATTFNQIKSFIDQAIAGKTWLILLFHQIDYSGEHYAVSPDIFQQMIDYLESINVKPATISEVLSQI